MGVAATSSPAVPMLHLASVRHYAFSKALESAHPSPLISFSSSAYITAEEFAHDDTSCRGCVYLSKELRGIPSPAVPPEVMT